MMTRLRLVLTLFLAVLAVPVAAQQGGPFAPRMIVNDKAITNYELTQRLRLVRVLGQPGNAEEIALDGLIDDRLRVAEATRLGVLPEDEAILAGMEEFAARANLTAEEFTALLTARGVARETFRDFVAAGIAWREVVRARYAPRVTISEAEIDRALALSSRKGGARVLMSELILPADTPERQASSQALADRLSRTISTTGGFASAARQYSVSSSRGRGGRIDWIPLANLPPQMAAMILTLAPGEVSEPIPLGQAIALFQLRAIEETGTPAADAVSVEYARFRLPDPARAEQVGIRLDTCDDLYGAAKGLPEEMLTREVKPMADIPRDLGMELAKLDPGEMITRAWGGGAEIVMLCARTPQLEASPDRGEIRQRLLNQRLGSYADSYLAELRADAIIREP
ncbi:periplasmic chaperone for outer membrane proteins SurA [Rhodovulum imhoffii]|uniref:Parvulin-like PPIase n=2 Tax=Rhodovulum imhoffii TaxID=365340 RepID=A0A2T5BVP0_9RHOB|nr:periplasmic chaperone for outer membrane proteins SurA [Rhodovulum imhoffii]